MKTCETCDFYVAKRGYTWGRCHRYPRPWAKSEWAGERNAEFINGQLPQVYGVDFCGEHKEDFNERD